MTLRLRVHEGVEFRYQRQHLLAHLATPVIGCYRELLQPVEDLVHAREVVGHGCERNDAPTPRAGMSSFMHVYADTDQLSASPPRLKRSTVFWRRDSPMTPAVASTRSPYGGSPGPEGHLMTLEPYQTEPDEDLR
jgi:hypothetical protein